MMGNPALASLVSAARKPKVVCGMSHIVELLDHGMVCHHKQVVPCALTCTVESPSKSVVFAKGAR